MIMNVYCVFDKKTSVFFPPFTSATDASVCRELTLQLRKGGPISEFPEDYELYCVGLFDDTDANIAPGVPPRFVCRLDSLRASPNGEAQGG